MKANHTRPPLERAWAITLPCLLLSACGGCDAPLTSTFTALVPAAETVGFGEVWVGTTARHAFSVQNLGSGTLTITSLTLEGDAAFTVEGGRSAQPLGGGGELVIDLVFAPTAAGATEAVLVLESDADNGAELRVRLTGTGREPPDCDDGNDCTAEAFDTALGECARTNRSGPCDAQNACVTESACVDGRCIGLGVGCDDGNPCTRNLCDAASGCVFLDDLDACGDDNPCTVDRCEAATGCASVDAPDGTPCAPLEGCVEVHACVAGECRAFPVPDGFPCEDGNVCTTGDRCHGGACGGDRQASPPREVARLHTFGSRTATAVVLSGGRIVFGDRELGLVNFSRYHLQHPRELRLTLVQATTAGLEQRGEPLVLERTGIAPESLVAIDDDRIAVLHLDAGLRTVVQTVAVEGDRLVLEMARPFALPPSSLCGQGCAALAGRLYTCVQGSDLLQVVSLADPAAPSVTTVPLAGACEQAVVDPATRGLFVQSRVANARMWQRFALTDPSAPVLADARAAEGDLLAVDSGRVAHQRRGASDWEIAVFDWAADRELGAVPGYLSPVVMSGGLLWLGEAGAPGPALRVFESGEPLAERGRLDLWVNPHLHPQRAPRPQHLIVRDRLVVLPGTSEFTARVLRLEGDGESSRLVNLTGPGHGRIGWLVPGESAVHTVATDTVLQFLPRGATSTWHAGGVLEQPAGVVRVRGVSGVVDVPVVLPSGVESSILPLASSPNPAVPVLWTDALTPGAPVVRGSLSFPTPQWLAAGYAGPLYGLSWPATDSMRLLEYGLADLVPAFGSTPVPVTALSVVPVVPRALAGSVWPARDGSGVAIATYAFDPRERPEHPTRVEVYERAAERLRLVGSATLVAQPQLSWEEGLLVVLDDDGGLTTFARPLVSGGALLERGRLVLDADSTLLGRYGNHAFVGSGNRLRVLELEPELRVLGETPGFVNAQSLAVIGEHLYLATPTTISVVHPPCPMP